MRYAVLLLCLGTSAGAMAAPLTLPLTAASLDGFLADAPDATLEDLLDALPPSLHENFVLMHASKSLHQATPAAPRQILFGSDARFLVAAGGVASDPRYQMLEFAEFDAADGNYHFGTVDFSSGRGVVSKNVARCGGCHGTPSRPIWGQYPNWDGAYGDEHGDVAADVQAPLAAFVAASSIAPRYRHLVFAKDASGKTFKLSARYYPYPNTDFNHELGNTVALGALTRAKRNAAFPRWRFAALATNPTLSCIDSDVWPSLVRRVNAAYAPLQDRYPATARVDVKAMRLLGIDTVSEFSLEQRAGEQMRGAGAQYQTGAFRIEEALAFQLLLDVSATDSVMRQLFVSEQSSIDYIAGRARLLGAERAEALRRSSSWFLFFDVFDPVIASSHRLEGVCGRLLQLLGE